MAAPLIIIALVLFVLVQGYFETGDVISLQLGEDSAWASVEALGVFAFTSSMQYAVFEIYLSTKREDKPYFVKVIVGFTGGLLIGLPNQILILSFLY